MAKDLGSTGSLRLPGIQYPPRRRNTPVARSVGSRNGSLEPMGHPPTHGRIAKNLPTFGWLIFTWMLIYSMVSYSRSIFTYMGVSKNSGLSPHIIHFNKVFHYKPSILGYLHFWKHPHGMVDFYGKLRSR